MAALNPSAKVKAPITQQGRRANIEGRFGAASTCPDYTYYIV
jgi:hypothetical protein